MRGSGPARGGGERDRGGALARGVPERVRLTVTPAFHGMRLDLYLRGCLPWRSRSSIRALIRLGRVRLGGERLGAKPPKPGQRLLAGDRIEIEPEEPPRGAIRHDRILLEFLHEDEQIAVLDKQPGILVHPVSSQTHNTIINALHYHYRVRLDRRDVFPRLVHRLDRDTSGVLLVSKTAGARRILQETFERRSVEKEYLALVHGTPEPSRGEIDAPLRMERREGGRAIMRVAAGGAPCRTRYEVLEGFAAHALVRLLPETGRTHQLRAHMRRLGHPILCDSLYGREERLEGGRAGCAGAAVLLARQALHSSRLSFPHPAGGARMEIRSPLPPDMAAVLRLLRSGGSLGSPGGGDDVPQHGGPSHA